MKFSKQILFLAGCFGSAFAQQQHIRGLSPKKTLQEALDPHAADSDYARKLISDILRVDPSGASQIMKILKETEGRDMYGSLVTSFSSREEVLSSDETLKIKPEVESSISFPIQPESIISANLQVPADPLQAVIEITTQRQPREGDTAPPNEMKLALSLESCGPNNICAYSGSIKKPFIFPVPPGQSFTVDIMKMEDYIAVQAAGEYIFMKGISIDYQLNSVAIAAAAKEGAPKTATVTVRDWLIVQPQE